MYIYIQSNAPHFGGEKISCIKTQTNITSINHYQNPCNRNIVAERNEKTYTLNLIVEV